MNLRPFKSPTMDNSTYLFVVFGFFVKYDQRPSRATQVHLHVPVDVSNQIVEGAQKGLLAIIVKLVLTRCFV